MESYITSSMEKST